MMKINLADGPSLLVIFVALVLGACGGDADTQGNDGTSQSDMTVTDVSISESDSPSATPLPAVPQAESDAMPTDSGELPSDAEASPTDAEASPTDAEALPRDAEADDSTTAVDDPDPSQTMRVYYGPGENQWLNLYLAESAAPTPIYLFAHANGGTADDVGGFVARLHNVGISTISWESVVLPNGNGDDIVTGWNDAELMLDWVKENAETYNLDVSRIIVGGRSRGSVFSWRLAHSEDPAIKGIYMFQALPDGAWLGEEWVPTVEVNENSPPMKLTYLEPRNTDDGHDPDNGYTILARYEALGIGDRAELVENVGTEPGLFSDIGTWCRARFDP